MGHNNSNDNNCSFNRLYHNIKMKEKIRIGCGAGFSGDRIEPALILAERGSIDYLVLECLAERTIALAQQRKMADPSKGYDLLLEKRMNGLLPLLVKNNITLISNMGAANPVEAAKHIIALAARQDINIKVAAVYGDDVLEYVRQNLAEMHDLEYNKPLSGYDIVSANAYLGHTGILEALQSGAQVIITGRVADPSLFLAPMMHEFGWQADDFNLLGRGTVIGHLLECGAQVTGGYFADGIHKKVDGLAAIGHPFADVFPDGSSVISKVAGTGGVVNLATVKEQLLYEVLNPHGYYTPDVIADFTTVCLTQTAKDQVRVTGGDGQQAPADYKASIGYKAFYLGEGEISYAGSSAYERAKLAAEIIAQRLKHEFDDLRIDLIGIQSLHQSSFDHHQKPYEVRVRVAAASSCIQKAALIGEEVEALYTNGPAGGGGARKYVNEVIGVVSALIDMKKISPAVQIFES